MKNLLKISCFTAAFICSLTSTQAMAIGKGFYVHLGSGSADWSAEYQDNSSINWDFESDTSHLGIGFVLDTATIEDRLFNYRFQVGYEKYKDEVKNSSASLDFESLVIDQDFGFGIVRNDAMRFWLGPELRISFSAASEDNFDVGLFGIGIGPAFGVNFHTASNVSLGLKGGFMIMSYDGVGNDTTAADNDVDYTVDEDIVFFNFAVLFR